MVSPADIAGVLAGLDGILPALEAQQTEELTLCIVDEWRRHEAFRESRRAGRPSNLLKKWREMQGLGRKLEVLAREMRQDLAYAVDRETQDARARIPPSLEELQALPPKHQAFASFAHAAGIVLPSTHAESLVADILKHLRALNKLAMSAELLDAGLLDETRRERPPPKQRDELRLAFVFTLSLIFRRFYQHEPTAYRDGAWCQFLAAVLTCLEKQERDTEHAYELWRKVESWAREGGA
jgi:hypothetical protein